MNAQTKKQMIPNVEVAMAIAGRMRQPSVQDRIALGRIALAVLKQVEPKNGEAKQVEMAAYLLARVLAREYANPEKSKEAAIVATELRSFAMGMRPMVDTLCLS